MKKLEKGCLTLIQIGFIVSLLLVSVNFNCFDYDFYKKEYTKLNTAASIGMSQESLDKTTEVLLDYLLDKRDDLIVEVEVYGHNREVFDERETIHMVDVKKLYLNAMKVKNIALIVWLLSLVYLFTLRKSDAKELLADTFKVAAITFGMFMAFLVVFALIDFNSFWTNFHHVFFPMNDFWLLDPNTEILINMVPEQFFFDLVMKIVGMFVLLFAGSGIIMYFLKKRGFKRV